MLVAFQMFKVRLGVPAGSVYSCRGATFNTLKLRPYAQLIPNVNAFFCTDDSSPMATSISPTYGRSNSSMEGRSDYDESPVMAMRAAASLSL